VAKKRVGKFPKAFRQMAVDRLNQCDNIGELAKELGIHRRLLYAWREKLEPLERGEGPPATSREATLRKEISHLKRVLAEKVLEVDFFKGALQQVEARRQRSGKTGAQASTPRSGR
jgi:transposase-like protein